MKKIFFVFIIIQNILATNLGEHKIISFIFNSLIDKNVISIYTEDEDIRDILNDTDFKIALFCENSDLIYNSKEIKSCDKPLFTNKYITLKESKSSIGAFYWKKGRPNIIFLNKRLEQYDLKLSSDLIKYGIDEL